MKKKMKNKRKWGKLVFVWSAVFFLAAAVLMQDISVVRAAESHMGFVMGKDSNGEMDFLSPAFALIMGEQEGCVVSFVYDGNSDEVSFIYGSEILELDVSNSENNEEENYALWPMENIDSDLMSRYDEFYYRAYPVQNETVTIYYVTASESDGLQMNSAETVLRELKNERILETDGLPNDLTYYPAVLVDTQGYCVGMVTKPGTVVSSWGNEEQFYRQSSGGGSDNGEDSGNSGSDNGGDSGNSGSDDNDNSNDNGGTPRRIRDADKEDDEDESFADRMGDNILILAFGIGIILVIAVLTVVLGKKKNPSARENPNPNNQQVVGGTGWNPNSNNQQVVGGTGWNPNSNNQQVVGGATGPIQQQGGYAEPTGSIGQNFDGSDGWEDPGPTAPVAPDNGNFRQQTPMAETKPQLYLHAVGGCMDGRKYPIGKNEITIGRYRANIISYPEGTPGVSRTHAKLYWDGGRLMLMDCNSSSGTYLRKIGKLQPMNPVEVNCGDIFYIGEKRNGFEIKK